MAPTRGPRRRQALPAPRAFPLAMLLALCTIGVLPAQGRNANEALNHYGLITLSDDAVGAELAARFKARGQPVFLVHDLNAGLGLNDFMRFADKVVLINGDVWATLQAEGALDKLRSAPVVRVQGRSLSQSWEERADLVGDPRQQKAFKMGAELLRVLEENFGGTPDRNQLTIVFGQNHMTLLAPSSFLDQLNFSPVRRVAPPGTPRIVSVPPDSGLFTERPFRFRIWGVDPSEPSGSLSYRLTGTLPPGLSWDAPSHTLRGTPRAPGRWPLTAVAENAAGLSDTLRFTLDFRVNRPPSLSGDSGSIAVAGREWRFAPVVSDPDHPSGVLNVAPGSRPEGMTYDPETRSLRWIPDSSLAGTRHTFFLSVEDPLGARDQLRHSVQVVARREMLFSEGVHIELPWNELMQGRNYVWKTRALTTAWAGQGIRLEDVTGDDSTLYFGDSLRLRPMAHGTHTLRFGFSVRGDALTQEITVPVREDRPPEFVSEIPGWKAADAGVERRYRPVAVDPEGEPVTLAPQLREDGPLTWDGKYLRLPADNPGTHPARVVARDAGGKTSEQWVVFRSMPEQSTSRWILENRTHGEYTTWTATADFGTGRIGLYSPNFTHGLNPDSYWFYKEPPFLFVGGNLMGRKAEALGRSLWADLGVTIRSPAPRVATGGLFARLNGEWHFPESPLSWIEMEVTGHVHQIMMATDSSMLFQLVGDTTDIISREQLSPDGTLSGLVLDAFRRDNATFFSRFEALGALGYGFYGGPSLWREDWPLEPRHIQRLGGALRYRANHGPNLYQFTFRMGWSPGGEGWGAFGSVRAAWGAPF